MGVLNVTPDSFSDGGRFATVDQAVAAGVRLSREGADLLDVGGESTRPGANPVTVEDELARVLPVVSGLVAHDLPVSIDTAKPAVAQAALAAGARVVNDVTGLEDPEMTSLVADSGAGVVIMHMQGSPRTMQDEPRYDDVVGEIAGFLEDRAARAEAAGVARDRIAIDPGIGFGKTLTHNVELLRNLDRFVSTGYPVLLGTSRKRFLAQILGNDLPAAERDGATGATVALAIEHGVAAVRVHNVALATQIARTTEAIIGRT